MAHKQISENEVSQLRSKKSDSNNIAPSDRYQHSYFIEIDPNNSNIQEYLVFTVKVKFLPGKPVYIDIRNLRDLISSMTRTLRNSETIKFKNELLDLLHHYEKIS